MIDYISSNESMLIDMLEIELKYKPLLLEALGDMMYKVSMELENYKGEPLDKARKELTNRQHEIEKLQHQISSASK